MCSFIFIKTPFPLNVLAHVSLFLWIISGQKLWADLGNQHLTHQRHVLPGDRAALLGGAYTALSDDPSGLFYNPSGMSFASKNEISLNILYSELSSTVVFRETVNGQDFQENSKTKFSSISGGVFKKGDLSFGYSILTLDNRNINQNDQFKDLASESSNLSQFDRIHQESNAYHLMGAAISYHLGKNFSLGISAFYYQRLVESMDFQLIKTTTDNLRVIASKIKTTNEGLIPVLGMLYKDNHWSIGFSLRQGISYNDHTEINIESIYYEKNETNTPPTIESYTSYPGFLDEVNPLTVGTGLAWFPSKYFLLSADVIYYQGLEVTNGFNNLKDTYNFSLGMELSLSFMRLTCGAFTNNSMVEKPDQTKFHNVTHIDYQGKSAGLTFIGKNIELTLGAIAQQGEGIAQIIAGSTDIQKVEGDSRMYFVAAKYRF